LGPGDLKRCGSGQNFNMDQIGDFEIIEAQFLIKNTSVEKLEIPIISGPIFLCL